MTFTNAGERLALEPTHVSRTSPTRLTWNMNWINSPSWMIDYVMSHDHTRIMSFLDRRASGIGDDDWCIVWAITSSDYQHFGGPHYLLYLNINDVDTWVGRFLFLCIGNMVVVELIKETSLREFRHPMRSGDLLAYLSQNCPSSGIVSGFLFYFVPL